MVQLDTEDWEVLWELGVLELDDVESAEGNSAVDCGEGFVFSIANISTWSTELRVSWSSSLTPETKENEKKIRKLCSAHHTLVTTLILKLKHYEIRNKNSSSTCFGSIRYY